MFLFATNITVSMSNRETRLRFVPALHQQLMYPFIRQGQALVQTWTEIS